MIRSVVVFAVAAVAALLGIVLRSIEVVTHNYVFLYDQGLDMLASRSIAVGHKLTLIGVEAGGGFAGLPGIFHGPGYHYLLALISVFSRGDPYGEMVALLFMQLAGLMVIFWMARKLFGFWAGIFALFIASVSPDLVGMARVLWAPNFSVLFVLLFLYVLLVRTHRNLFWAGVLGVVATGLYNFEIPIAAAAALAALLYLLVVERPVSARAVGAYLIGCAIGIFPMIAFDARHGWTTVRGLVGFVTHPVTVTKSAPFDFMGNFRAILFHISGVFPPIPNLAYWFWPATLLLGLVVALRADADRRRKTAVYGLLCVVAAHLLVFIPFRNPVYGHYLTLLSFSVIFIVGYIGAVGKNRIVPYLFVIAVSVAAIILYAKTIPKDFRDTGGTAKIKGKIEAIDEVYREAAGKPFNLLIFTPPVYTYPYDYLLVWYAARRYGYVPGHEKAGNAFLLIEPDPEKPWSYNGWLETVIKTGNVVSTKTLPSGFIIQKRIFSS